MILAAVLNIEVVWRTRALQITLREWGWIVVVSRTLSERRCLWFLLRSFWQWNLGDCFQKVWIIVKVVGGMGAVLGQLRHVDGVC